MRPSHSHAEKARTPGTGGGARQGVSNSRARLLPLVPVLVALLVYANTIPGDFIFDDVVLIKQGWELHDLDLERIFLKNYWGPDRTDQNYRPLTLLSYALNWQLGEGAWSFHVVNVLLNAGVALLAYWILVELLQEGWLAALGAALYTALPIHTEAVANIVGRAELLAGLSIFGAWLLALKSPAAGAWQSERTGLAMATSLVTFLGMCSKENVIVVPFILVSNLFLRRKIPWKALAGCIVSILVYLLLRHQVIGEKTDGTSFVDNQLKFQETLPRVLNALSLLGLYLYKTVFPFRLSADYAFNQIPVLEARDPLLWAYALLAVVPMAIATPLAIGTWLDRKRAPLVSLAIIFFFVTIAPTANVFFWIGTMFGERLAYTPSFAYPLFLCALLTMKPLQRLPGTGYALLSLLILLYAARAWARNQDWAASTIMNLRMSQDAPKSTRSHFMSAVGHYDLSLQAGSAAEKNEEINKAFEELSRALEIDPTYGRAYAKRGEILHSEGRHQEAVEQLTKALEILAGKVPPELEPGVLRWRGECFFQLQKYSEAFKDFDDYIRVLERRSARPDGRAHNFRALCYAVAGRLEDALKDFNTAVAFRADIPEIWNNRGFCRYRLKDYLGAIEDYQKGLEICRNEKLYEAEAATFRKKIGDVYREIAATERGAGNEAGAKAAEAEAEKYLGEAPNLMRTQ